MLNLIGRRIRSLRRRHPPQFSPRGQFGDWRFDVAQSSCRAQTQAAEEGQPARKEIGDS